MLLSIVFVLAASVVRAQSLTTYLDLHDFGGTVTTSNGTSGPDGKDPAGGVTFDNAGNIYGTAEEGGAGSDYGMVWEITASGTYKDLHDFGGTVTNADGQTGPDGSNPNAGITFDSAGNAYGTTLQGGAIGWGTVWEITTSGAYKDLHDFGGTVTNVNGESGLDGENAVAGVTFDTSGNMYGTAQLGGANLEGMVWKITKSGNYVDLHDFGGTVTNANGNSGPDGGGPLAAVTVDTLGNVYGTTMVGGANGGGMAWEYSKSGTYVNLHDFGGTVTNANGNSGPDGNYPFAGITFDAVGNIYGTTQSGGARADGMVWEIAKSGTYYDLHDFGGTITNTNGKSGPDGGGPTAAVVFDGAGNMYGTARGGGPIVSILSGPSGMVWEITTSGAYKDLHDFGGTVTNADGTSGPDGANPYAGVTLDGAGNLYGTTTLGGGLNNYGGVVWALASESITLTLSPPSVLGGQTATGTVTLGQGAPFGGLTVTLGSQYPTSVGVPSSIKIPAGSATGTFSITTVLYAKGYTNWIDASDSFSSQSAKLTVLNPLTLTLSPATATGGMSATGTVTLSESSQSDVVVTLGSQYPSSVGVPPSITIPAGSTVGTFNITTTLYAGGYTDNIEATCLGATQVAQLTILGDPVASLTLSPTRVVGGVDSTGTITLTSAAPSGGLTVTLGSQYPTSVGVPATVTVPEGQTSVTFKITTKLYSSTYTDYIQATYLGVVHSALLTVTSGSSNT